MLLSKYISGGFRYQPLCPFLLGSILQVVDEEATRRGCAGGWWVLYPVSDRYGALLPVLRDPLGHSCAWPLFILPYVDRPIEGPYTAT